MRPLQVDPDALRLLAVRCRDWAAELPRPPQIEVGSIPATAAAIATVQSGLHEAADALSRRMRETAELIGDAVDCYRDADWRGAVALRECVIRT